MVSKYFKLQEFARGIDCKLTKVRPEGSALKNTYYIILKNGQLRGSDTLSHVANLLYNEHKKQSGYYSHGHSDLMRNPMRD